MVALVHKETTEYGFPFFGQDHGTAILQWVRRRYRESALYGTTPFIGRGQFGVSILEPR